MTYIPANECGPSATYSWFGRESWWWVVVNDIGGSFLGAVADGSRVGGPSPDALESHWRRFSREREAAVGWLGLAR
jgi:hypothetical protein